MENEYLVHHGVKGMKWGVRSAETLRKYGSSVGDRIATKATHLSKEERAQVRAAKAEQRHQSARRSLMTDDELKDYTKRLENQKKVKDLTAQELYPGRTAVKNTMGRYGGQAAAIFVGATVGYIGQQFVNNYMK